MPATLPTSVLLGGSAGWPRGAAVGVSVGVATLRLAAEPGGRLGLGAADGSLGGLTLPRRVAADRHGAVFLLHRERVLHLDRARRRFVTVPYVGGRGRDARRLRRAAAVAVSDRDLYVADRGNHRVQVFDRRSLTLVRIWAPPRFDPADVATGPDAAYVLDAANGRIHRYEHGSGRASLLISGTAGRWSRIAVDRDLRIYAYDAAAGVLDVFDADGRPAGRVEDAGDVRDRFDQPAVRSDGQGRLVVSGLDDMRFDRAGRPVVRAPDEPPGPGPYRRSGQWTSRGLDSGIHRCQWHRIELDLDLPTGTRAVVLTRSAAADPAEHSDAWDTRRVLTGRAQPTGAGDARTDEFLVQSPAGRYLRVRIELYGDGHATPGVRSARVHFPRQSYLEYLPAVYGADDNSRWFLERYLSIVQTEWDAISQNTRTVDRLFGAGSAPDDFLRYLCSWLNLPVEPDWSADQIRVALLAAGRIYRKRGTAAAVRGWLKVYLTHMTGSRPPDDGYPLLLEGYAERRWLALATERTARLDIGAPLWGPGVVGRLQVGVFSRTGEVRLVSTGDPEHDVFDEFAHRFSVFLPAAWVRTAGDEARIRRCLDAERPAHTAYRLCLVEARTRVGVQSTVGVDTIVGARPVARLACRHDADRPPSRRPEHRLGHDMVLAGAAPGPGPRVSGPRAIHRRSKEPS